MLLVNGAPVSAEDGSASLENALTNGKLSFSLRYRLEAVDQDDRFDDRATASTLRTTLAYRTLAWHGLSAFIELEDVHGLGLEGSHNNAGAGSLWNGVSTRPVIADPESTELNQAYLRATWANGVTLQAGRQEVLRGNTRFVGNVGWRQNHQSFDAVLLELTPSAGTTLSYGYLDRVYRIVGSSKPMQSHLLEAEHRFTDAVPLRGYGYLLDYDRPADDRLSTSTLGISLTGSAPLAGASLRYRAELARQRDAGANPGRIDAGYRRADLGLSHGKLTITLGYELLEGRAGHGSFSTPLATLHAFNGWADLFLATPPAGLEDLSLVIAAKLGATNLRLIWHELSADSTAVSYGSELDALAVHTLPWKQQLGLKLALYRADQHGVDTSKVMVWTSWGF